MDKQIFELSLLSSHAADGGNPASFVVLARYGSDIAIEPLTCEELHTRQQFRADLRGMILGDEKRPTADALRKFGRQLFDFTIRGDVLRLYNRLPSTEHVCLHLVSNCPAQMALPWEYLREPNDVFPNPSRSVVRIVPTIGQVFDLGGQSAQGGKIRLLFVWSESANEGIVEWDVIEKDIKDTFRHLRKPENFEITVVEAANRQSLLCDTPMARRAGRAVASVVASARGLVSRLCLAATTEDLPWAPQKRGSRLRLRRG